MKQLRFFLLPLLLLAVFAASSQDVITVSQKTTKLTAKQFFKSDEVLDLTLLSNFKKIRSQKKKGEFLDAVATLYLSATDSITEPVSICARGEFRREQCQMPSLMVNFRNTAPSLLNGLKKMKLVCGCSSGSYNESLLLKEYLAYKIYNFLSDMSFKARLVKVTYKDAADKVKPYTQYAFFIEDVDDMASRNSCNEFEKVAVGSQLCDRKQTTLMNLFQYMIGNTDWSVPNYHNIKLIQLKTDSTSAPYAVPYDFDFAGIVNAPYAIPQEEFKIEKVTDRLYRGYPRTEDEIEMALRVFRDAKDNIKNTILAFDLLSLKERKTMIDYVDGFYSILNNKGEVKYQFVNGARQ